MSDTIVRHLLIAGLLMVAWDAAGAVANVFKPLMPPCGSSIVFACIRHAQP